MWSSWAPVSNRDRFESVLVAGVENPGERSLLDYVERRGIHPLIIPEIVGEANFGWRDVVAIAKVYRVLKRENPHILDTHTAKAGFAGRIAARLAGVPVVIHTYHGHVWRGYYSSIKSRLLQLMEKGLALWTDQIITVSESVRQEIVEYGIAPLAKIKVVPLGFDLRAFFDCAERRGPFRKEIGVPPDVPLIGTIGRVVPIKNHRQFLDAAKLVLNAIPEARFVIVGDGLIRPDLESYGARSALPRVVFAGWRRDLPNIYADTGCRRDFVHQRRHAHLGNRSDGGRTSRRRDTRGGRAGHRPGWQDGRSRAARRRDGNGGCHRASVARS